MSREALDHILGPLRKSQRTIFVLVVEAMAAMRQAACISIALALAQRVKCQADFIKLLLQQSGHTFVVRLAENVKVCNSRGAKTLRKWGLQPGRAFDLGDVDLRQDAAVRIRVVGIWAGGHREPWWLATNRDDSLGHPVAL